MDCIKGNGTSSARALPTVQAVAASQANIIAASSETPSDNAMDTEISLLSLGLLETVLETTPKARGIFKQLCMFGRFDHFEDGSGLRHTALLSQMLATTAKPSAGRSAPALPKLWLLLICVGCLPLVFQRSVR